MTLEYEWQKEEQKRQEEPEAHTPPETEFEFLALVQNGDIRGVNANLSQRKFRQIALVTPLSKNMLQNFRYHSVVTIALMTRFCIDGGMPMEQAYRISDFYIQKIDEAGNLDQVEMLHNAACRDFTQRMGEVRKRPISSKPITLCLNYIYSHQHDRITVQTLAREIGLHPSYLSRLFREQMHCTLHEYILKEKVESAKQMLQFSDRSFADIANLLAFSSQSHFTQVFSKFIGMTPPDSIQDKHFRNNLM